MKPEVQTDVTSKALGVNSFPRLRAVSAAVVPSADALVELRKALASRETANPRSLLLIQGTQETLPFLREAAMSQGYTDAEIAELRMYGSGDRELLDVIYTADDIIVVLPPEEQGRMESLKEYAFAEESGRIDFINAVTGEISPCPNPDGPPPNEWLAQLFAQVGLAPDATLQEIFQKTDALAQQVAPATRAWWQRVLALQALALILPCAWFLADPFRFPPWVAAVLGALGIVLLVSLVWWLRWRAMQTTWARSRLVAEVARSFYATADVPMTPSLNGLETVPALRFLLWHAARVDGSVPLEKNPYPPATLKEGEADDGFDHAEGWVRKYGIGRIRDQRQYFTREQGRSANQRKGLTEWATKLMDVSLGLAAFGLVVTISPFTSNWLPAMGGEKFHAILGLGGAALLLCILIIQELKGALELGRRSARFAEQVKMLVAASRRLLNVPAQEDQVSVVRNIERSLRAEVVEWYFLAETTEHFFDRFIKAKSGPGERLAPDTRRQAPATMAWVGSRLVSRTAAISLFSLKVLLGRIVLPLIAVAAVLAYLSLMHYANPKQQMAVLGFNLVNADGSDWQPGPLAQERGLIIIAHGLHGNIFKTEEEKKKMAGTVEDEIHWARQMARTLRAELGEDGPDICLVDWSQEAKGLAYGRTFFEDVGGIRPQARLKGDGLALVLNHWIREKQIADTKPIHFIGHSAGGFLVSRAAMSLEDEAQDGIHITILDTPAIDEEITVELAESFAGRIDFYQTSMLAVNDLPTNPAFHFLLIEDKLRDPNPVAAHSYANIWFIDTIKNKSLKEGFQRSPFAAGIRQQALADQD